MGAFQDLQSQCYAEDFHGLALNDLAKMVLLNYDSGV
jgi:hypothetical protein